MTEHPYLDFDGDGHGDPYDTVVDPLGHRAFLHHDTSGQIDAIAFDSNADGLVESMATDENHDGGLDHILDDTTGDGFMDTASPAGGAAQPIEHPAIDFDGDGDADPYLTATHGFAQSFHHTDGSGHVDAVALDFNLDGLIDAMQVDDDHDGVLDHVLTDTDGDGIMDTTSPL